MSEVEIRMQAAMFALVSEMNAIMVWVEGMKADNLIRESNNESLAWSGSEFSSASIEIEKIAEKLRTEI